MLAGLFVGAAIPAVPYPCLMLAAHSAGFIAGGLLSMIAGLSLSSSRCKLRLDQSAPRRCGGITNWPDGADGLKPLGSPAKCRSRSTPQGRSIRGRGGRNTHRDYSSL